MSDSDFSSSLKNCFGGEWLTIEKNDELITVEIIISELRITMGISIRANMDGNLAVSIGNRTIHQHHPLIAEFRGQKRSWNLIFHIVKRMRTELYYCAGITDPSAISVSKTDWCHSANFISQTTVDENASKSGLRSTECEFLIRRRTHGPSDTICQKCRLCQAELLKCHKKSSTVSESPPSTKYARYSPAEIRGLLSKRNVMIDTLRIQVRRLEDRLFKLNQHKKRPVAVQCMELLEQDSESGSPSIPETASLFLCEQFKAHKSDGMRWNRNFLNFALRLYLKSASAYKFLLASAAIKLPSICTLSRFMSKLPKCIGLDDDIIMSIVNEYLSTFQQPYAKYLAMSIDEMRIKANLVYSRKENELVGYVDSTDTMNAFTGQPVGREDHGQFIAKDVLVVYIRGIATGFERAVAWFPVRSLRAGDIMSIVWNTKQKVEFFSIRNGHAKLKVVTVTCDGLSANYLFFKLHGDDVSQLQYKAADSLDPTNFIYFIVDPPHLLKTIRNNFEKSRGDNSGIKFLEYNKPILWDHVEEIYKDDSQNIWRLLPKLSHRHVYLTASDRMKVKLAVQVLSRKVSIAMKDRPHMEDSAQLCEIANRLFDMLNGSYYEEHHYTLNYDLGPYKSAEDACLEWLQTRCLTFFKNWEEEVNSKPLSNSEKQRRLLSRETRAGLYITINGFVEAVRWILSQPDRPPYILSEVFNQDRLEVYFGHVRAAGGSNEHPDLSQFQRIATALNYVDASKLAAVRGSNIS